MKELLAHRAGIYSQKKEITTRQAGWIRNFGLTLEQSVQGIAREPLISQPGSDSRYPSCATLLIIPSLAGPDKGLSGVSHDAR